MTDRALLRRYATHRDAEAFAELVRGYQRMVFATCRRVLHSPADLDDAVQETFLRLAQKASEVRSNLGSWLHRCAMNVAMDFNRRRDARRRHETSAALRADAVSEGQRDLAELREHVDTALARLAEDQRELIVQRFFVGRSQGELATELGVAGSTMSYRVEKAVEALREQLASMGCVAGVGVITAMMEVEQVASVPQALTVNVMKIGLKGVNAGKAAGVLGSMSGRLMGIAAGLVIVAILGVVWWLGWGRATAVAAGPVVPLAQVAPVQAKADAVPVKQRYLDFQAVDSATGKGVPDAALTIELATEMKQESLRTTTAKTDADGRRRIPLPDQDLVMLRVRVKRDGLVPMSVMWVNAELRGGLLPSYVLKMEKGTEIGGVVQDEQGHGIAGASVLLLVPGSERGSDHPRADIWDYEVKTDTQGKWRCDIMPSKLDEVLLKLSHPAFQSDATYGGSGQPKVEELRKMSAVLVLKKGMSVAGKVVDADGHPVAGVTIRQGDSRWGTSFPQTNTNAAGEFRFANAKPGKMTLTAEAPGRMPELKEVDVRPGMEAVEFKMKVGTGFVGQVVDAEGKPIQGATVVADTWRGKRTIDWNGTTDAEGRFEWEDAPADEVKYHILKQGFVSNRNATGVSGNEVPRFTLVKQTKIRGKVTDADDGKPIKTFRAVLGSRSNSGWYWEERRSRSLTDGWYEAVASEPGDEYAVRIEADGYLPSVTPGVKAGTPEAVCDVKLKRGTGPAGVVRTPDGKVVAGARFAVANSGTAVSVQNGKMEVRNWNSRGQPEEPVTDANGRYSVPPQREDATLVVVHDLGVAVVPLKPATSTLDVTLQPWASMEGTLRSGKNVLANTSFNISPESTGMERMNVSSSATTDAQGHFSVDRLPAMRMNVHRFGKKVGEITPMVWMAELEPKPGEKIRRDLGGEGVRMIGRVEVPPMLAGKAVQGVMYPKQPRMECPENWDQMSQEERTQWMQQRQNTHPNSRQSGVNSVFVGADGSLEFCDVKPGSFMMMLYLDENNQRLAEYRREVTVGKGTPDDVVDLGVLKLEPARRLEVGKAALPLELRTMDGKAVTSQELRGKWTLVTGWTTWHASIPGQRRPEEVVGTIRDRCGDEDKLQMVSLFFDERMVWVQRYLAKHPIPGMLVYVGEENGKILDEISAYMGARGVLIDPEGVVRATNILAEQDMPAAVAKAMQGRTQTP